MSLLDNLHEKARTTKKKGLRYPLLIASGIANWIAGTYDEIKGHGEAAKDSEDEKDYKLYEEGVKTAMMGEAGAFSGAVYTHNKPAAIILGADLAVRNLNGLVSVTKYLKRMKEGPDSGGRIDLDLTGAIGTVRTIAYKLVAKYGRSGAAPEEYDCGEDNLGEAEALIFPDPLPDPIEDEVSETEDEGEDLLSLDFDPEPSPEPVELPSPEPEPFDQEPMQLPAPGEGYNLPDIMGPVEEDHVPEPKPAADYIIPVEDLDPEDDNPLGDDGLDDASVVGFETPSKPEIDIGPLGASYTPPEAEPETGTQTETDDGEEEDP